MSKNLIDKIFAGAYITAFSTGLYIAPVGDAEEYLYKTSQIYETARISSQQKVNSFDKSSPKSYPDPSSFFLVGIGLYGIANHELKRLKKIT